MGLFDWVGNVVNKVVSPVVGTLGGGIATATGVSATGGLATSSAEGIAAQERMFDKELAFRKEEIEAIKQASTTGTQLGAGAVSAPATKPTSEVVQKPSLVPLAAGLTIGYFVLKKKRGKK